MFTVWEVGLIIGVVLILTYFSPKKKRGGVQSQDD